jgi:hypothetical protein
MLAVVVICYWSLFINDLHTTLYGDLWLRLWKYNERRVMHQPDLN